MPNSNNLLEKRPRRPLADEWVRTNERCGCVVKTYEDGISICFKYKPDTATRYIPGISAMLPWSVVRAIISNASKAGMDHSRPQDQRESSSPPAATEQSPGPGVSPALPRRFPQGLILTR